MSDITGGDMPMTILDTVPDAEAKSHWAFDETERLASDEVLESLLRIRNHHSLAIDNSVALYIAPGFGSLNTKAVEVLFQPDSTNLQILIDPSEAKLLEIVNRIENRKVRAYLKRKAKGGAKGIFNVRTGLTRIDLPIPQLKKPLRLHVAPLSYWVEEQFNKAILENPDKDLLDLREESLKKILSPQNPVEIPCPSQLYTEICLITADEKLVVLEKSGRLSALARKGVRWTCSIEEGLIWGEYFRKNQINFVGAVKSGVDIELTIKANEIAGVEFCGIALEHTHLNTAFIGFMKLSVSSDDLKARIEAAEDFGLSYRFVDLESAVNTLFVDPKIDAASWHPTARMRILLTLYRIFGHERIWNQLIRKR